MLIPRLIAIVAAVAAAAPCAAEENPPAAPLPKAPKADPILDGHLAAIAAAREPGDAVRRYADARAEYPTHLKLHTVYMRKMLNFGYPRLAYYPALALTRQKPDNATAWAVVAYQQAKTGKLSDAIEPAVHAAALAPKAPAILNNAGYLLGRRDGLTVTPRLPAAAQAIVAKHQKGWTRRQAFASPYKEAKRFYQKQDKTNQQLDETIDTQEKALREMIELSRRYDAAIGRNNGRIRDLERDHEKLQGEIRMIRIRIDRTANDGGLRRHLKSLESRRNGIDADIRKVKRDNDKIVRDARGLRKKYNTAREKLKEAQDEQNKQKGKRLEMTWMPPPVDGKVVEDIEADGRIVPFAVSDGGRPGKTPADGPVGGDADDRDHRANEALKLARLLLKNERRDAGIQALKDVLTKYKGTPAAAEARQLLDYLNR